VVLQPEQRVQRQPQDGVGVGARRLLDLDAAFGAGDDGHRPRATIENEAQVELFGNVRRRRDQDGLHRHALDVQADDLVRPLLCLVRRRRQLHATRFAASADQDLGLDHHRPADVLRGGARFLWRARHLAGQQWHAMAGEDLLGSVLLELQAALLRWRARTTARLAGTPRLYREPDTVSDRCRPEGVGPTLSTRMPAL
jgi:hypothetical protein